MTEQSTSCEVKQDMVKKTIFPLWPTDVKYPLVTSAHIDRGYQMAKNYTKENPVKVATVVVIVLSPVIVPHIISAAGFTTIGVAKSSLAASAQSIFYKGATTGLFSWFQSAGAAGTGISFTKAIGAAAFVEPVAEAIAAAKAITFVEVVSMSTAAVQNTARIARLSKDVVITAQVASTAVHYARTKGPVLIEDAKRTAHATVDAVSDKAQQVANVTRSAVSTLADTTQHVATATSSAASNVAHATRSAAKSTVDASVYVAHAFGDATKSAAKVGWEGITDSSKKVAQVTSGAAMGAVHGLQQNAQSGYIWIMDRNRSTNPSLPSPPLPALPNNTTPSIPLAQSPA